MNKNQQFANEACNKELLRIRRCSPMVGIVVTISPSLSLYNMVVLPAASRPTIRIRISFLAKSLLKSFVKVSPISRFSGLKPARSHLKRWDTQTQDANQRACKSPASNIMEKKKKSNRTQKIRLASDNTESERRNQSTSKY